MRPDEPHGHVWPDAPDPEPLGGPPAEPPGRPPAVVVGAGALLLVSGLQLTFVATLLLAGIERVLIPPLALAGGLATAGMVAAIRAWAGRDWWIDIVVAGLLLLVAPWLLGFDTVGFVAIVLSSVALIGLARGRPWFLGPDDREV